MLWGAGVLGVIAVIPYVLTLLAPKLEKIQHEKLPLPLTALLSLQFLQYAVFVAIAVGLGLFLAGRAGFSAQLLEGWLTGAGVAERLKTMLIPSMLLGASVAVVILLLDVFLFRPHLPQLLSEAPKPPLWQRFLASFYGGIPEELYMRLFLFSLLAWLFAKIVHTPEGLPTSAVLWVVNFIVAVLFGLGHLPVTAVFVPLTPLIISRALLLNGLCSLAYGYLYWRYGLEAAMLAHFTSNIVLILHVIAATFLGTP